MCTQLANHVMRRRSGLPWQAELLLLTMNRAHGDARIDWRIASGRASVRKHAGCEIGVNLGNCPCDRAADEFERAGIR